MAPGADVTNAVDRPLTVDDIARIREHCLQHDTLSALPQLYGGVLVVWLDTATITGPMEHSAALCFPAPPEVPRLRVQAPSKHRNKPWVKSRAEQWKQNRRSHR